MEDGWGSRCVMYVFYTNKYLRIDYVNGCSRGLGGRRLLRYDISELWEMGGGAEMQAVEAVEQNWSVSLCRVKTWPQLMCCALV